MKDFGKNLLLSAAFVLATTISAFAGNDVPTITITPTAFTKKFNLVIDNLAGTAKVQLRTANGDMLAEEYVAQGASFAKAFNLESLPLGRYEVAILTETRETIQPIVITSKGVEISTDERREIYAPAIVIKDGYIDLNLLSNEIGNVEVNIIDDAGNVLHSDSHKNIFKLERRYNTAKLALGNYIVSVSASGRTYYRSFTVR